MTQLLNKYYNIMLDLETLGTTPGSVIISLAAVPFDMNGTYMAEALYLKFSAMHAGAFGFRTSVQTQMWWIKQSTEARNEAFSGVSTPLDLVESLSTYLEQSPDVKVWGNGANFDNVLVAAYYEKLDRKLPWKYTNDRCYRTLKNITPPKLLTHKPTVAHNALYDAEAQAKNCVAALNYLAEVTGANDDYPD